MSTAAPPALKLRPRAVNTIQGGVHGTKSAPSVAQKVQAKSTCVASIPSKKARLRGVTTRSSSSVTHRSTHMGKPVVPEKPLVDVVATCEPQACGRTTAASSTISTPAAHLRDVGRSLSSTALASQKFEASVELSNGAAVVVSQVRSRNSSAARPGFSSSSVRGGSDKSSVYLRQRPPMVPRVGQLFSNAVVEQTTSVGALPIRRTSSATNGLTTPSAAGSQLCSRAPSVHETAISSTPRRTSRRTRPSASAPTSRLNSVNSRLADCATQSAHQPQQRPRTSSVHVIAPKRNYSKATNTAPAASASATVPTFHMVEAIMGLSMLTPSTTLGAPPRLIGTRPLLEKNIAVSSKSGGANVAPCSRALQPSPQPELGVDRETRRVCGGASRREISYAVGCTSARGPSPQVLLRRQRHQCSSARRTTAPATVSKAHRKTGSDGMSDTTIIPTTASSQQKDTACPPPLSFADYMKRSNSAAVPRGPVSPIKRIATACPSAAQHYSAALVDRPARLSDGLASPIRDAAFANPWIKASMFSTPTNGGCGRDASEAPTIPYEGSTGPRHSMSLSPRTDFDTFSVSGRLSCSTYAEVAHE
ncbi:hypothetical protein JKF63_01414 [Porcisia hertigi]|uniref:Uncharacterized protein n=1 Tax=Porcisia hertigi TaxID=2761500 RepID=A0A836HJQ0_9TRYP|nr:hypothetical protein JKF63_01414 [Porcisia hertigi]